MINRVLIVGLGSIGKRHLRLARELLPSADIRVLRHTYTDVIPEYANGCFFELEQALDYAPDIAVVANPATYHIQIALAFANRGVHLLIEKPLSATIEGVQQLLEICNVKKIVLLTGYNLRYLSSLQRFRDLIMADTIGNVLSVRCEIGQYLPSWRTDSDYRHGVSAQQSLGGGALLELSHELDYLRWIFGDVEWVKATLSRQSSLDIDVEDSAHITLAFAPDGSKRQMIGTVNLDFIRHDTTRLCTAIGEGGSLRWNGLSGVVEQFEAGAKEWNEVFKSPHQRDDSYLAEWKNFIACIDEGSAPLVSGEDGLKVLEIVEAARKSSESGCQARIANIHSIIEGQV